MSAIGKTLSPPDLALAIEANVIAFNLVPVFGTRAQLHDEPELLWFTTGLPYPKFNGVLRARLPAAHLDAQIEAILTPFRANGLPLNWCLGPSTRPPDLGRHLQAHGLSLATSMPGMAADLETINLRAPPRPDLTIRRVRDAHGLAGWLGPVATGFDFTPEMARAVVELYADLGFAVYLPLRHYAVWQDGAVVAGASLYLADATAGLYYVTTRPERRRQGIGTALTLALLREARALGCRLAVLHASPMGFGLYRRLGFRTYCTLDFYTWPNRYETRDERLDDRLRD